MLTKAFFFLNNLFYFAHAAGLGAGCTRPHTQALRRPRALTALGRPALTAFPSSGQSIWESQYGNFTTLPFSALAGSTFPSSLQPPLKT